MQPAPDQALELQHFDALKESIVNILRTPYGDRGGIFLPDWGSLTQQWLHEPIDEATAFAMRMTLFEDIRRHHPLVRLDHGRTAVVPNPGGRPPGYDVRIAIDVAPYLEAGLTFDFRLAA